MIHTFFIRVLHWDAVHFLFPGRLYGTIYLLNFVSLTLILCSADDSTLICLILLLTNILLHRCPVFNCIMAHYKFPLLLLFWLLYVVSAVWGSVQSYTGQLSWRHSVQRRG